MGEKELYNLVTFYSHEMLKEVYFRFFKADANGKFSMKAKNVSSDSVSWLTEQRHRLSGKCFTLTPEPWMEKLGIYYLRFKL